MVRGLRVLIAAAVAAPMMLQVPVASADQVEVNERVKDSLVWIRTEYEAVVRVPAEHAPSGKETSYPARIAGTCTGFVVDPAGFIATAAHCVDPDFMVFGRLRASVISDWDLSPEEFDAMVETANAERWSIEASLEGEEVDRIVEVIQAEDPDRVIDRWTNVQVVDSQRFLDGDNALLRVTGVDPMPALTIAEEPPRIGEQVTCIGFPGSVRRIADSSRVQQPSFKTGTVSSVQVDPRGAPTTEINADMSGGMSGGPTVNANAEVLGINSYSPTVETQPFNFITDTTTLRAFLQRNGIDLTRAPSPAPAAAAPTSSFPWVTVLLAVIAAVAVVVAIALAIVGGRRGLFEDEPAPRKRRSVRRKRPAKKAAEVTAAKDAPSTGEEPKGTASAVDEPPSAQVTNAKKAAQPENSKPTG